MIINKFALFLVIASAVTSVFWLVYKLKFKKPHQEALAAEKTPERKHVLFESIGGFFPVIFFVLIFRSFLFEPFQIPSSSMLKTLLVGDFLLVNKFNYGIKNPVTNETWIEFNQPERGDVVVFKAPDQGNIDYIKRVIGLPGERVIYNPGTKELAIFPKCVAPLNECKPVPISYGELTQSDFFDVSSSVQTDLIIPLEENAPDPEGLPGRRLLERTETIDGNTYSILIHPTDYDVPESYHKSSKSIGNNNYEFVIPEDSYFVMGDNRDNSQDGRYFGPIHKDSLVGNAVFIWISFDRLPGEWPTGIRFNRIGTIH